MSILRITLLAIFSLFLAISHADIPPPIHTTEVPGALLNFSPPSFLYFAPLQLKRQTTTDASVYYHDVNVLPSEQRNLIGYGKIAYFGMVSISAPQHSPFFITKSSAVLCTAILTPPAPLGATISAQIAIIPSNPPTSLMEPFPFTITTGTQLQMFFYEAEFQKKFDSLPAGTIITMTCPPEVAISTVDVVVDPVSFPSSLSLDFHNFKTQFIEHTHQYAAADEIATAYPISANALSGMLSGPMFDPPSTSIDITPSDAATKDQVLVQLDYKHTQPVIDYSGFDDAQYLPQPVNLFHLYMHLFTSQYVIDAINTQFGDFGIPCKTDTHEVVGYLRPPSSLTWSGGVVTLAYTYSGLSNTLSTTEVANKPFAFATFTASQACRVHFYLPHSLAFLSVQNDKMYDAAGVFGVNGLPLSFDGGALTRPVTLTLQDFYGIANAELTFPVSGLKPNGAPYIEIRGVTPLSSSGEAVDNYDATAGHVLVAEVVFTGVDTSSEIYFPEVCFWTTSSTITYTATAGISDGFIQKCFLNQIGVDLAADPANFPPLSASSLPGCLKWPFPVTESGNPIQSATCLIQTPVASRLSFHLGLTTGDSFPVTRVSSSDPIEFNKHVPYRIIRADGKNYEATQSKFFNDLVVPEEAMKTTLSALGSPSTTVNVPSSTPKDEVSAANNPDGSWPRYHTSSVVTGLTGQFTHGGRVKFLDTPNPTSPLYLEGSFMSNNSLNNPLFTNPKVINLLNGGVLWFDAPSTGNYFRLEIPVLSPLIENENQLKIPHSYNVLRFFGDRWILTSQTLMDFPSTISNGGKDWLINAVTATNSPPYNVFQYDVGLPSSFWYRDNDVGSIPRVPDFTKFPTYLFQHLQIVLTNLCSEYVIGDETKVIADIQGCKEGLYFDVTLRDNTSTTAIHFDPPTTVPGVQSVQFVDNALIQADETTYPHTFQHPAKYLFKLTIGSLASMGPYFAASGAFHDKFLASLRQVFTGSIPMPSLMSRKIPYVPPTSLTAPYISFGDFISRVLTIPVSINTSSTAPDWFTTQIIIDPSLTDANDPTITRSLVPGDLVRFQINWALVIDEAVLAKFRSSSSSFILYACYEAQCVPITISSIKHRTGFPYSFTVPYIAEPITTFVLGPHQTVDSPVHLSQVLDTTGFAITLQPDSTADFLPRLTFSTASIPTPTWASQLTEISTHAPGYVVVLQNTRTPSFHQSILAAAASTWSFYAGGLSTQYTPIFPTDPVDSDTNSPFYGLPADFRRFSVAALNNPTDTNFQASNAALSTGTFVIYQNPSPFLKKNSLDYVFQGAYPLFDDEPIDHVNLADSYDLSSPDFPLYYLSTITIPMGSYRNYPLADLAADYSNISSSLSTIGATYKLEFARLSSSAQFTATITATTPSWVTFKNSRLLHRPTLLLPSRPDSLYSIIVVSVGGIHFPIFPYGLDEVPTSDDDYPLFFNPFAQFYDKYADATPDLQTIFIPFIRNDLAGISASYNFFVGYAQNGLHTVQLPQAQIDLLSDAFVGYECNDNSHWAVTLQDFGAPQGSCVAPPQYPHSLPQMHTPVQTTIRLVNNFDFDARIEADGCYELFYAVPQLENEPEYKLSHLAYRLMARELQFAIRLRGEHPQLRVELVGSDLSLNDPATTAGTSTFTQLVLSFILMLPDEEGVEPFTVEDSPFGQDFSCGLWRDLESLIPLHSYPDGVMRHLLGCTTDALALNSEFPDFIVGQMYTPDTGIPPSPLDRFSTYPARYDTISTGYDDPDNVILGPRRNHITYPEYVPMESAFLILPATFEIECGLVGDAVNPLTDISAQFRLPISNPTSPLTLFVQLSFKMLEFGEDQANISLALPSTYSPLPLQTTTPFPPQFQVFVVESDGSTTQPLSAGTGYLPLGTRLRIECMRPNCSLINYKLRARTLGDNDNTIRIDTFPLTLDQSDPSIAVVTVNPANGLANPLITYNVLELTQTPSLHTSQTVLLGFDDESHVYYLPLNLDPTQYNPATRTVTVDWKYHNLRTSREPGVVAPNYTLFFKVYMSDYPNAVLGSDSVRNMILLTASYTITKELTSITSSTRKIANSLYIPDFITTASFYIPPRPSLSDGFALHFVCINDPNPNVTDPLNSSFNFFIQSATPIKTICEEFPESSTCQACDQSGWSYDGCKQSFSPIDTPGKCVAKGLVCPKYMTIDQSTCTCQCTTQQCIQNTRGAMLYFQPLLNADYLQVDRRTTLFITRTLQMEIATELKLNSLPQPRTVCLSGRPNCHRSYPDASDPEYAPPIGYETLSLYPMTFNTTRTDEIVAYLTVQPFSSLINNDAALQLQLGQRLTFLQTKLIAILQKGVGQPGARTLNTLHQRSPSPDSPYKGHFIPLTLPTTQLSPTVIRPGKMTTQCGTPDGTTWTYQCPSVSALKSPFWPQCPADTTEDPTLNLNIRCVDLFGTQYAPSTAINAPTPWCTAEQLFPHFPNPSAIKPCTKQQFTPATITSFTATPATTAALGDTIRFDWVYPSAANPSYTMDILVTPQNRRLSSTASSPSVVIRDEFDESGLTIAPLGMDIQQQNLDTGYSVLLGTFPASQGHAVITLPYNLVSEDTKAYFASRLTQVANQRQFSDLFTIVYSSVCQDVVCDQDDPLLICKPTLSSYECACPTGAKLNIETGLCQFNCNGLCAHGLCQLDGCRCESSEFTGKFCHIDTKCASQNSRYCDNHGSVLFNGKTCGTTCTCSNHWGQDTTDTTPTEAQCQFCTLLDFGTENSPCFSTGTNSTRTTRRDCDKCYCNNGYAGDVCDQRVFYGTLHFNAPSSQTPPISSSPQLFPLDDDTIATLIRDMALSMSVPMSGVKLVQSATITKTPPSSSPLTILQNSQVVNALTFQFQQDDNTDLPALYDLWGDLQSSFPTTPIGQSEAQQVTGEPTADPVLDGYDPVCDPASVGNCPHGEDPFFDFDDVYPTQSSPASNTALIIGVVLGVVVAALIFIIAICGVRYCRKHQNACFKPNKRDDNDHLELTTSEASTARTGDSTTASNSGSGKSTTSNTNYSSGTSTAVDLVETPLDEGEQPLPDGWSKMKHCETHEIIYINKKEMKSLNHHPLVASTKRGRYF